jgi:hypothetical protein
MYIKHNTLVCASVMKANGPASVLQGHKTAVFREFSETHQYTPCEKVRYMVHIFTTEL